MKLYSLQSSLDLQIEPKQCWDFFSNPKNLQEITPDYMGFEILEGADRPMYAGQVISYKVSPVLGIKMSWVTEITHLKEGEYFVDEQRFGPYKFWHHKHFFEPITGGTRCVDIVHYAPPLSLIAPIINSLSIRPKLEEVFAYRTKRLKEIFTVIE